MVPLVVGLGMTIPLIGVGVWLYLRLRESTVSPPVRIAVVWAVFLFLLPTGPAVYAMWYWFDRESTRDAVHCVNVWLISLACVGAELRRLSKNSKEK